jgi:hypothetical protein
MIFQGRQEFMLQEWNAGRLQPVPVAGGNLPQIMHNPGIHKAIVNQGVADLSTVIPV